jgi:glutaredoxin
MFFIYGRLDSKACDKAEFLLYTLGYEYRFYVLGRDFTLKQFNRLLPNEDTVPQVFYNTKHIGGIRDLYEYLYTNKSLIDGNPYRLSMAERFFDIDVEDK